MPLPGQSPWTWALSEGRPGPLYGVQAGEDEAGRAIGGRGWGGPESHHSGASEGTPARAGLRGQNLAPVPPPTNVCQGPQPSVTTSGTVVGPPAWRRTQNVVCVVRAGRGSV